MEEKNDVVLRVATNYGLTPEEAKEFKFGFFTMVAKYPVLKTLNKTSVLNAFLELRKLNLNLEIDTAYVVPYGDKAQLQIGYKGYIELALRTKKYKAIDCVPIKEGDLKGFISSERRYIWDLRPKNIKEYEEWQKKPILGWRAFSKDKFGMTQDFYMSISEINKHHEKFSKTWAYRQKAGNIFNIAKDQMDRKTVLKKFVMTYLAMSLDNTPETSDLMRAAKVDQSSIDKGHKLHYVDNPTYKGEGK